MTTGGGGYRLCRKSVGLASLTPVFNESFQQLNKAYKGKIPDKLQFCLEGEADDLKFDVYVKVEGDEAPLSGKLKDYAKLEEIATRSNLNEVVGVAVRRAEREAERELGSVRFYLRRQGFDELKFAVYMQKEYKQKLRSNACRHLQAFRV